MFCSAHCNRPGHELLEGFQGYYVGDANGDPVGKSAFSIGCTKQWTTPGRKAGGPCHFRPLNVGSWQTDNNPDHVLRAYCFDQGQDGSFVRKADKAGCESAESDFYTNRSIRIFTLKTVFNNLMNVRNIEGSKGVFF